MVCFNAVKKVSQTDPAAMNGRLITQWCRQASSNRRKTPMRCHHSTQFDMTTLSSLNRHACATLEDVGTPKVIAMQRFLKKIAPWAQ